MEGQKRTESLASKVLASFLSLVVVALIVWGLVAIGYDWDPQWLLPPGIGLTAGSLWYFWRACRK